MARKKNRIYDNLEDKMRLEKIADIISTPLHYLEGVHKVDKVEMVMQPKTYPIFQRKILSPIKVTGLWWLDEDQWVQFMWHGHGNPAVIRNDVDADRVFATRTFSEGSLFIRKMNDRYDIEGRTKLNGQTWEWVTVSITPSTYKMLDEFLGPVQDGCRHEDRKLYVNRRRT